MKELIAAGILISLSTALKVCCVVVLCSTEMRLHEHDHHHADVILAQKKEMQTSHQPIA